VVVLWAYGTSPHGLALSEADFWMLSQREYYVLQDVQQADARRWATALAVTVNMNLSKDAVAFTADDFLGLGDRAKRVQDKQVSDMKAGSLNRQLSKVRVTRPASPNQKGSPCGRGATSARSAEWYSA